MQKKNIHYVIIGLIVVFAGILIVQMMRFAGSHKAMIESFVVDDGYMIARTHNVVYTEVWGIPVGSDVTEDNYIKMFSMEKVSEEGNTETWKAKIPTSPLIVSKIFVKAFDSSENVVGNLSLPYENSSELNTALWGEKFSTTTPVKKAPLKK
jgi:hypothetical protein